MYVNPVLQLLIKGL